MEVEYLDRKFKVYEDGNVERMNPRSKKWKMVKLSLNDGYYKMEVRNGKMVQLHRLIYKAFNPEWDIENTTQQIDHINGIRNDNRIENLRCVSHQQNQHNRTKAKGCIFRKGRYESNIKLNNKSIFLGCYKTEEEARNAYLNAKIKYHNINLEHH